MVPASMPKSVFTEAYASFVEVLVQFRLDAGVTQTDLAARLGKPQPFVSYVESGERRVDVVEFYAIARALDLDPVEAFALASKSFPKKVKI